jgi:HK97 family phage prohead protease
MHAPGKSSKRGYDDFEPAISERRYYKTLLEARALDADGKPSHIIGYASSFGNLSRKLGGDFVERVMPTAFEAAQSEGWPDVVCRYNHKDDYLLGTTLGGTLQLMTDAVGLKYDVLVPEHRSDVMELVARGDVQYSSFAFRCIEDDWQESSFGYPMRSLHSLELIDVAPVQNPAYFDTTAKVGRSMDELEGAIRSLARFKSADPDEIRSMMEDGNLKKLFKKSKKNKKVEAEPVETEETRTDEAQTEEVPETATEAPAEEVRTDEAQTETEETRTDETQAETEETREEVPAIDVSAELRKLMSRRYHEYEL